MKILIEYTIEHKKVIDISPEEYCYLRANFNYGNYFPEESKYRDLRINDEESEIELLKFFSQKNKNT